MTYHASEYWEARHRARAGTCDAVGCLALGEGFNRVTYRRRLAAAGRTLLATSEGSAPARVLEAGVGVGAYHALWQRLGVSRWVGLDISPVAIERLRRLHPQHEFHTVDLSSPGAPAWNALRSEEPFDAVTAIDVLYHITDDGQCALALDHLAALVRQGGVLVLSDVFVETPRQRAEHVRRRPLSFYEERLARSGFALAHRQPVFAVLGEPIPRAGFRPFQHALKACWWMLQEVIRSSPEAARELVGAASASLLTPFDRLLCGLGAATGVNLELVAFRRDTAAAETRGG